MAIKHADRDLYIVTDIETMGKKPGFASMASIGAVAVAPDGTIKGEFSANLVELATMNRDPSTMQFWADFPAAWAAHRVDTQLPDEALFEFVAWVQSLCQPCQYPVIVAAPVSFDVAFIDWYFTYYGIDSPFACALDMGTFAMALMGKPRRYANKRNYPARWHSSLPHTHIAIEDAREQADSFIKMLKSWHEIHDFSKLPAEDEHD